MDILLWILVFVFSFVLSGVLAARRGRSVIGFLLISLLLSPLISIVVVLLVGKSEKGMERKALANGYKKCPACAELVRREAKICKHCGTEFEAPPKGVLERLKDLEEKRDRGEITPSDFERERIEIFK